MKVVAFIYGKKTKNFWYLGGMMVCFLRKIL